MKTMEAELEAAKRDVAVELRKLADGYRFQGQIFHAALVERFLNGTPTVALEAKEKQS